MGEYSDAAKIYIAGLEELERQHQLDISSKEALIRIADKKPSWKEKNWLLIAVIAFILGFIADIGKEVLIHKMYPEQKETKNPIQEKKDTFHLQK